MRFGMMIGTFAVVVAMALSALPGSAQTVLPLPGATPKPEAAAPATGAKPATPAPAATPIVAPPVRAGLPGFTAPVDRDQIRLRALDRCIYGLWNHKSINKEKLTGQCQCAATRTSRAATDDDLKAMSESLKYAPTVEGAFREAIAACVKP